MNHSVRRALAVETLEDRRLMDAGGVAFVLPLPLARLLVGPRTPTMKDIAIIGYKGSSIIQTSDRALEFTLGAPGGRAPRRFVDLDKPDRRMILGTAPGFEFRLRGFNLPPTNKTPETSKSTTNAPEESGVPLAPLAPEGAPFLPQVGSMSLGLPTTEIVAPVASHPHMSEFFAVSQGVSAPVLPPEPRLANLGSGTYDLPPPVLLASSQGSFRIFAGADPAGVRDGPGIPSLLPERIEDLPFLPSRESVLPENGSAVRDAFPTLPAGLITDGLMVGMAPLTQGLQPLADRLSQFPEESASILSWFGVAAMLLAGALAVQRAPRRSGQLGTETPEFRYAEDFV